MAKRVRRTWPLVLGWAIALVVIGGVVALQANITPLYWAIRTCALLGYLGVFLSVVSSAYLRPLVRYFGRPFVQTHHALSVTSLVLITLHPLAVALSFGSLNVFVPILNSWIEFLRWGGALPGTSWPSPRWQHCCAPGFASSGERSTCSTIWLFSWRPPMPTCSARTFNPSSSRSWPSPWPSSWSSP